MMCDVGVGVFYLSGRQGKSNFFLSCVDICLVPISNFLKKNKNIKNKKPRGEKMFPFGKWGYG